MLTLYHLTYLIAVFKVANFQLGGIGALFKKLFIRVTLLSFAIIGFRFFIGSELAQWIGSVIAMLLCYGILALLRFRRQPAA
jgi:hypothetical protein